MTDHDWRCGDDFDVMMRLVLGQSARKARLFAAAYCRRADEWWLVGSDVIDDTLRPAADGTADPERLVEALGEVARLVRIASQPEVEFNPLNAHQGTHYEMLAGNREVVPVLALATALLDTGLDFREQMRRLCGWSRRRDGIRRVGCELVREVYENPFRPVAFDPAWRTGTVIDLARTIYADGAFDGLPILADALADADCSDESLLGHLRSGGPHVHGCWALDLVLGRE